jgi:clan AA aspartic protease
VIDTGFTGFLSLPPATVAALGLTWLQIETAMLADGSIQVFDVYTASIIWDTQSRTIRVTAVDTSPLVGTKLLQGNEVRIEVKPNGRVTIDLLP